MVIFLPVIKIPTRNTFETAQNAPTIDMTRIDIEARICVSGGGITAILIIMTLGAKTGIIERVIARVPAGLRTMAMAITIGITCMRIRGV